MTLDKLSSEELMTLDFDQVVEAIDILKVRQNALIRKFKSGDKVYFVRKNGAGIEGDLRPNDEEERQGQADQHCRWA